MCDELDNYRWIIEYFKEVSTNQDNVALLDMYNGIKNYTYVSVYKNFYLSIAFGCELISFVTKTQNTVSIEDGFLGFDAFSYTSANYADANVQKKLLEFIPKNTYTTEDETFNLVPGYQMLYNFLGWYDEDGNKVEQIEKGTTGNINLVAKYAPRQYSISFVLNGGTLEDAPTVYDVTTLSNFSYIIPTKEGYKFLNWYSDPEFTNILSRIYEYQDYVLYAKWEASDNTISYDAKEGSIIPDFKTYDDFANKLLASVNDTNLECTVETITEIDDPLHFLRFINSIMLGTNNIGKNPWIIEYFKQVTNPDNLPLLSMYDNFKSISMMIHLGFPEFYTALGCEYVGFISKTQYSVEFKNNANFHHTDYFTYTSADYSDPAVRNQLYDFLPRYTYSIEDETFNLAPAYLRGYNFLGWYDKDGNKYERIEQGTSQNLELEAKFEPRKYAITYELDGGTIQNAPQYYDFANLEITIPHPEKPGYIFSGWEYDAPMNGRVVENGIELSQRLEDADVYKIDQYVNQPMILTAKWSAITYTITYNPGEGKLPTGIRKEGTYTYSELIADFMVGFNFVTQTNVSSDGSDFYQKTATTDGSNIVYDFFNNEEYGSYWVPFLTIINETRVASGKAALTASDPQEEIRGEVHNLFNRIAPGNQTSSYGCDYSNETVYGKVWNYYDKAEEIEYVLPGYYTVETLPYMLPEPVAPEGYLFAGWYTNKELTGEVIFGLPIGTYGNFTLYAKYVLK